MTTELDVRAIRADDWEQFAALFGTSKQCSECWCMNHRCTPEREVVGDQAKAALRLLLDGDQLHGVVALDAGALVGWCAIDPIATQTGHDYVLAKNGQLDDTTWAIHCVYVGPDSRGRGVSSRLVSTAIEYAREHGATSVLAFPIPAANREKFGANDDEFSGRWSTFHRLGFELVEQLDEFYSVVRFATERT